MGKRNKFIVIFFMFVMSVSAFAGAIHGTLVAKSDAETFNQEHIDLWIENSREETYDA